MGCYGGSGGFPAAGRTESSFFLDAVMRFNRIDGLEPIVDMEKFQDLLAFLLLQGGAGVIFSADVS